MAEEEEEVLWKREHMMTVSAMMDLLPTLPSACQIRLKAGSRAEQLMDSRARGVSERAQDDSVIPLVLGRFHAMFGASAVTVGVGRTNGLLKSFTYSIDGI